MSSDNVLHSDIYGDRRRVKWDVLSNSHAVGNYLFVRMIVPPEKTEGGIILSGDARGEEEAQFAYVMSVGNSVGKTLSYKMDDCDVPEVGDIVMIHKWSGTGGGQIYCDDDNTYRFIQDKEIYNIIKNNYA